MKKLYIRFFDNKDDGIPINSDAIDLSKFPTEQKLSMMWNGAMALEWMTNHPNGKVDFVWL